jgi:hypothetical protein
MRASSWKRLDWQSIVTRHSCCSMRSWPEMRTLAGVVVEGRSEKDQWFDLAMGAGVMLLVLIATFVLLGDSGPDVVAPLPEEYAVDR